MERHKDPKRFLLLPCAMTRNKAGKTVLDEQSQDFIISAGMPVICRKNNVGQGLVNNDETYVVNFNKKTKKVKVANPGGKEEFSYVEFTEYYNPAYAITIHRSQGQTYTEPYCLTELDLIKRCREGRELLYVALTRARSKSLVRLDPTRSKWVETCDKTYSRACLQQKVEAYQRLDRAKNRHNDLTEGKVRELIKQSSNICYYCRNTLNPRTFTLDRVESHGLGHTVANCVTCCYDCNIRKNDLTVNDDMMR
jgi:ATP-dependent exoDNAse (exonuclease V) alpha subunit